MPRFTGPGLGYLDDRYLNEPTDDTVNFYVATTGDDSNPGTSALPFATIQKGFDAASGVRTNGEININVSDGTYTEEVTVPQAALGIINLIGNTTTATNVVIDANNIGANTGLTHTSSRAIVIVHGVKITNGFIGVTVNNATLRLKWAVIDGNVNGLFAENQAVVEFLDNADGHVDFVGAGSSAHAGIILSSGSSMSVFQDLDFSNLGIAMRINDFSSVTFNFGYTMDIDLLGGGTEGLGVFAGSYVRLFSDFDITGTTKTNNVTGFLFSDCSVTGLNGANYDFDTLEYGVRTNGQTYLDFAEAVWTYTNVDTDVELGYPTVWRSSDTFDTTEVYGEVLNENYAYDRRFQRMLTADTSSVGNVGAGEDDLITYSLPASTMSVDGDTVRIRAWGSFAANANAKQVKLKFGATEVFASSSQTQNGGDWSFDGVVTRTGSATQIASTVFNSDGSTFDAEAGDTINTSPAETLSGAVTIKCVATGTANDDILQEGLIVEFLPNIT